MKQICMLLLLLCALCIAANAQTNDTKQKTISVTGTAEAEVVPDEIYVQVDLREYDKRGVGKIELDTIKNNFIAACKSIGLPDSDISVQAYQSNINYWQLRRSRKKDPDLKAGISYVIKLRTTKTMDELVDKLDDEATQNFFIARIDYSKKTELKKQLKINAIKAAKDKATYLTDAINEHVGGAVSINDEDDNNSVVVRGYVPQRSYTQAANSGTRAAYFSDNSDNGIGFQKIKYQFQVSVVFGLQ